MKVPQDLRYTESHEWVKREADGTVSVGITDHAQEQLGDIVFVEAPKPGRKVTVGEAGGGVESVEAASDIYAPGSGEVVAAHEALSGAPGQGDADAYAAWVDRVKPDNPEELDKLLDSAAYEKAASA